jgi:hypothetical protein
MRVSVYINYVNSSLFADVAKGLKRTESTKPRNDIGNHVDSCTDAHGNESNATGEKPAISCGSCAPPPPSAPRARPLFPACSPSCLRAPAPARSAAPIHRQLLPASERLLHASSRLLRRQLVPASAGLLPACGRLLTS